MRILLDGRFYGLENAGLGRYTINLVKELVQLDTKNEYVILLRKKYFDGLKFPKNWKKILADYRHYTLAEQIKLPTVIEKQNPDIAHFLNFNIPVFYKGKFIVTIHDLLMPKHRNARATTLPFYFFYPKHLASRYAMRQAVVKSEKVIVPSSAVKKEVVDYYNINSQKVEVIYEGVSVQTISHKPLTINHEPYFLYVGNAYPHKNLERLIKAIVYLNKVTKRKVLLSIASSRDIFTKRLEEQIKKIGASGYVKLLGFVPDEDLGSLYKNSIAFVYPSLSEGFGLPGLEAMASGTIALVSDIPVFKEIYKDSAIYFDPYDVYSIASSMEKVLAMNNEQRTKLVSYGKEFVKHYSWSKMAREILRLYESCASLR